MRMRELRRNNRESFTLIELLIVMSIIVVLVSLSLAAVMHFLYKPQEVRAVTEMHQMDGSIQQFMTKYDVGYIPSQIKICRNYSTYLNPQTGQPATQLDRESIDYLTKTIGRNSTNPLNPNSFISKWQSTAGIQWTPNMPTGGSEILEGHQCLVFFLGGLFTQTGSQFNCQGFSSDVSHPDVPPTQGNGIGPFYVFNPNRLQIPPGKTYFPAYIDSYSPRPNGITGFYAYFSSYKHQNGYNRYGVSDCASLGVWPYASSGTPTVQFVRPNDWQIISAGTDGKFGPGTDPTSASPYYWNKSTYGQIPQVGQDDQSNFAFGKLQYGE